MIEIGRVDAIWRYPVSSLRGEALERAELQTSGVPGDRLWGLVDRETGEIAAPEKKKRWRPAGQVAARLAPDGRSAEISLARGPWLPFDGPEARAALAGHFGFAVDVRPHPGGGLPPTAGPEVAPRYERHAVHLVTTASLGTLAALLPGSAVDPRRFRPNLVVATDAGPGRAPGGFPEGEWIGRELRVGGARLRVEEGCKRCAFTVIAQDDLPLDPAILAAIARHNDSILGVLCSVVEPGPARRGDPVGLI